MTSSTKPEVHNILNCHQTRANARTGNTYRKTGFWHMRADKQTDTPWSLSTYLTYEGQSDIIRSEDAAAGVTGVTYSDVTGDKQTAAEAGNHVTWRDGWRQLAYRRHHRKSSSKQLTQWNQHDPRLSSSQCCFSSQHLSRCGFSYSDGRHFSLSSVNSFVKTYL